MFRLTTQNVIILGVAFYFLFVRNKSGGQGDLSYTGYGDGYEGIYGGDY